MTTEIITSPDIDQVVTTTVVEDIDQGQEDDNLRHIVRPVDNEHLFQFYTMGGYPKAQDLVDIARSRGLTVTALCGKTWVPKNNPEGRDTCDSCVGIAGMIKGGS